MPGQLHLDFCLYSCMVAGFIFMFVIRSVISRSFLFVMHWFTILNSETNELNITCAPQYQRIVYCVVPALIYKYLINSKNHPSYSLKPNIPSSQTNLLLFKEIHLDHRLQFSLLIEWLLEELATLDVTSSQSFSYESWINQI